MTPAREATTHLADLLRRERHALGEFLLALAVFDRERRWADLGYKSLFAFLNRELGLSKAATYYRLTAARLIQHAAVRPGTLSGREGPRRSLGRPANGPVAARRAARRLGNVLWAGPRG